MNFKQFLQPCLTILLIALAVPLSVTAQEGSSELDGPPALTTSELTFMLRQQEKRFEARFKEQAEALAAQRQLIDEQKAALETQSESIEALQVQVKSIGTTATAQPTGTQDQQKELAAQREAITTQTAAIQALQTQFDQFSQQQQQTLSEADQQIRARLESLEGTMTDLTEQETTSTYDASEFPGAFQVPGTSAALRIGGFVKANVVQGLDGVVGSRDRFIVGTIPTRGATTSDQEATLTASQSRVNFEYRQDTERGQLRAFIEGDFAGSGDTYRLRHAFGQFRDILAGKYWTNFMDASSVPEEIDFEGVNGRVTVRQPQIRYFPELGKGWNLILTVEDTSAEITEGSGISAVPDFIASVRRTVRDEWNVKFAALVRSLEARWTIDDTFKDDEIGWGFSLTGRRSVRWWDPRDSVTVQLNYGEGIGRYVNDTNTVGGLDGVFDANGNLKLLPIFGGFVSFQKYWTDRFRSTAILSLVDIDNYDFQPGDAYSRTLRFSTNLIWSPVPAIDIGGELMFGTREDRDGGEGDASQFQLAARYRF
ncbi:MAG: porin [Chromatiales bacterium]|nr:MAG: porin [Chromatiales bacterium]